MASSMVIKVKYGDTLRRFNATVNGNDQLDLDMVGLKAKVLSLFSLNPDADITLTYIDEDGDVVTLVDDDDLRDAMRQELKFLRIDVQLKNDKSGRSYARSSGSSTPLRSSSDQLPLPNINRIATEVLKPVPEPVRAALLRLSHESAKVASTSPAVANLVDSLSRMGLSFSLPQLIGETSAQNPTSASPEVPSAAAGSKSPQLSPKSNQEAPKTNLVDVGNGTGGAGPTVTPVRPSVDLNKPPAECDSSEPTDLKSIPVAVSAGDDRKKKQQVDSNLKGKLVGCEPSASSSVPIKHVKKCPLPTRDGFTNPFNECPFSGVPVLNNPALPPPAFRPFHPTKRNHAEAMGGIFHRGIRCDGCGVHPITGPRFKSKVKEDYDLCSVCFSEMGVESDYIRIDRPLSFRHPMLFKGTHEQHPWVIPPALPHFLRKAGRPKLDSRFILDVNVMDGTMMAPFTPFTKIWRMRNNGTLVWPQGSQLVWIGGDRFSGTLTAEMEIPAEGVPIDSELDVAVDFIAPEHPGRYISYWRMATPSGQKFGQRVWVLIQVDVSLSNAFSSSIPLSLVLPPFTSGTQHHQPINVNVDTGMECDLSKPSNGFAEPVKPMNVQQPRNEELNFPIDESLLVGHGVSSASVTEATSRVSYPIVDLTKDSSNDLFSEAAPAVSVPVPVPTPASAPVDMFEPAPAFLPMFEPAPAPVPVSMFEPAPATAPAAATSPAPSPVVDATPSSPVIEAPPSPAVNAASSSQGASQNVFEEALLKELEEMGFKQIDLNKEILRMNEYNLEQSVDDLCGVAEWDPLLEELEDMGFCDAETNKKLLAKNNGSIKRVVMDLVNGEKNA